MFRFSFATEIWTNTTDLKSWKLMPYPKPSEESPTGTMFTYSGIAGAGEESMAYIHVDLNYPIAARNVPMVKMCLDQGVDVNAKFPMANSYGMTPLMKAVDTAYETTRYDTIGTTLLMRRDARRIVQMLLDHGADKSPEARDLAKDTRGSKHQPDWLIIELLAPSPHPKLRQFISLTDAVWDGEQEKLEDMLIQEPGLWSASEFQGISPLGAAVHRNDERMVSMLLGRGAPPNALDPMGLSPLAIAVASNLEIIAKILLQYGASITSVNPFLKLNPIEYAAREGNHTMCSTLLGNEKRQNPYDKKELLSKPFALALIKYHIEVIVVLLEHGADVFMNMQPFLHLTERGQGGFSYFDLTPGEFLRAKLSSSVSVYKNLTRVPTTPLAEQPFGNTLHQTEGYRSRLCAVLKEYEIRANKKTSQRSGELPSDDSQLEDLILFE
jgi:hypothetical protein